MSSRKKKPKTDSSRESLAEIVKLIPGYDPHKRCETFVFDESKAQASLDFFAECLTHVKGSKASKQFALEPWQKSIIANTFGWVRGDGTRRYREVFIYVPRKNGKSTLCAGIVLLLLFCDGEAGAEIYSAAADREQAALVFAHAKGMVLAEPELRSRAKIYATFKSIEFPERAGFYRAISAEADTKHGFNTHGAIIDELHAQPNRELCDVLTTSTGSRTNPLIVYITTADFDRPSICNEKYDYACKVRDGLIDDPGFLPVIYEATPEDDWTSPEVWKKANPNLGISIGREYFEREFQRARETPTYENTFKRLHLNIRTTTDQKWLDLAQWDSCAEAIPEEQLFNRPCFGGLDLSQKIDVTAWSLVFPPTADDPKWRIRLRCWVPQERADARERRDRVPYRTWANQGHIELIPGDVIDQKIIEAAILADAQKFALQDIGFDTWNAMQMAMQLEANGAQMVKFGQGFASMSEPTKELEKLVISQRIAHGGNPVLRWMASNVMLETDAAGNVKPSKKKSRERIDGIVATVMALGRAMVTEVQQGFEYQSIEL